MSGQAVKSVAELLAEARANAHQLLGLEGSPVSHARVAVELLCDAIEQMQSRGMVDTDGAELRTIPEAYNAGLRDGDARAVDRIVRLFETHDGQINQWIVKRIRESSR